MSEGAIFLSKRQIKHNEIAMNTKQPQGVRPLDHITVVSLEHAVAAPFCTRHLADLGARVIKVERPVLGDFA